MEVTKIYTQFTNGELQEAHDRYSPVEEDITSDINNRSEGNEGNPDNANS